MHTLDETVLGRLEKTHASGITSGEILSVFSEHGIGLSEATLRKYVQLGLLPRSVRVGRKGKHQGSQGLYPVGVVRQICHIKRMMAENLTIDQICRQFLFIRSDLQQLDQLLSGIYLKLDTVLADRKSDPAARRVTRSVSEARSLGNELVIRLGRIETQLTLAPALPSAAAS